MIITPLGHSCFKLQESTGTTVITDPYSEKIGITLPACSADVVTVSHQHFDHNNVNAVSGNPLIIQSAGRFEHKGVHIMGINSTHDGKNGTLRGSNIIFNFRMDGVNVCHLGDIGDKPSPLLIEAIGPVDVLLVPVGGTYTIDARTAMEYVDKLMPAVVIPMHYKTDDVDLDIAAVHDFADCFEKEDTMRITDGRVEFDRADFDDDYTTKLILFED